jgi:hypothetical protein
MTSQAQVSCDRDGARFERTAASIPESTHAGLPRGRARGTTTFTPNKPTKFDYRSSVKQPRFFLQIESRPSNLETLSKAPEGVFAIQDSSSLCRPFQPRSRAGARS